MIRILNLLVFKPNGNKRKDRFRLDRILVISRTKGKKGSCQTPKGEISETSKSSQIFWK